MLLGGDKEEIERIKEDKNKKIKGDKETKTGLNTLISA